MTFQYTYVIKNVILMINYSYLGIVGGHYSKLEIIFKNGHPQIKHCHI